jgi:hypothetical protein
VSSRWSGTYRTSLTGRCSSPNMTLPVMSVAPLLLAAINMKLAIVMPTAFVLVAVRSRATTAGATVRRSEVMIAVIA